MKKFLIRSLIALAVVIIVAIVAVGLFLDSAIKKGVEIVGPQLTKVSVNLDSASLSLLSGSGAIKGLVVGNPEGYKTPQAISVGKASVSVSPGSLLSDKIVVKSIRVEAPDITFEGGLGGNNLSKILDNVNAASGGSTDKNAPLATAPAKPGKKLQIDDFLITGARVHVSIAGLAGKSTTVPLPDIHFTDLGKDSDGITSAELTKQVLREVLAGAIQAARSTVTDLGKGALDMTKEAGKTATETVGKATRGITDLLKKKP